MAETNDSVLLSYDSMLQGGMHFGRKRTVFNPRMGKYVFSVRDSICIIDLIKTQEALIQGVALLNKTLQDGGLVLFIAPTKQALESVKALADAAGMPYVLDRWLGGTLTNFKVINSRVKRLVELEEQKAKGGWDKYTKKEQVELERLLQDMTKKFHGLKKLVRMPDLVFVASVKEGKLAVHEAKTMGVKILAIANTDANPDGLVVIPANDRSKKSVDLLVDALRENLSVDKVVLQATV